MLKKLISCVIGCFILTAAQAMVVVHKKSDGDLIGEIKTVEVKPGQTFSTIARSFDVGYYEMIEANPGVSPENPQPGTMLIVPSRYVLPNVPRVGIVINLAEMRLFYYVPLSKKIMSFPIGIGRLGWNTPIGRYKIIQKTKDPKWIAPESIRRWRAKQGVEIPKVWPAGPNNPLGKYAMRLSNPSYMIHGTSQPDGVGRRVSSGCIRLYPEDIEKLFKNVPMDTKVRLINQSYKAGFYRGHLMVESHLPLQESTKLISRSPSELVPIKKVIKGKKVKINWSKLFTVSRGQSGVPQSVGQLIR